jgi:uncharacterized protein YggE
MKTLLLILTLVLPLQMFAQVRGNAQRAKGNVNYAEGNRNYNYNNNNSNNTATTIFPNPQWQAGRVVELEVNALSNQLADTYVAIFNIKQLGKTAEEAEKLMMDRYNGFYNAAISAGLAKEDIYLDMISFVPVYEYEEEKKLFSKKTYNEIPKGFEIQQNIHVRYVDPQILSKLVSAAAKHEIYDIVKVDYFVEDVDKVYMELREKAVEYINKEVLAFEKLGVALDESERIFTEDERAAYPLDRYSSYQAFSSQSLDGTSKGRVNNVDKAVTMYYDKLPYDEFEVIVNPTILEPAVQFMYSLKVRFTLKAVEPQIKIEREKEFVWLTPDGQLRTLKVDKLKEQGNSRTTGGTTVIPEVD